jgi:hypothetical protein
MRFSNPLHYICVYRYSSELRNISYEALFLAPLWKSTTRGSRVAQFVRLLFTTTDYESAVIILQMSTSTYAAISTKDETMQYAMQCKQ